MDLSNADWKWKAWYSDNSVYSSENIDWVDLPDDGMIVAVEYCYVNDQRYRNVFTGGDWYYRDNGRIQYVSSKQWGKDEPKPKIDCLSCIKRGGGMGDDAYQDMYNSAWEDSE
jgi:hypothetical protein